MEFGQIGTKFGTSFIIYQKKDNFMGNQKIDVRIVKLVDFESYYSPL